MPEQTAKLLSLPMRKMLISHIDRPQPVDTRDPAHQRTRLYLYERRLLRPSTSDGYAVAHGQRERFSALTDTGRAVVAWVLAYYAEALILAGFTVDAGEQAPTMAPKINSALSILLERGAAPMEGARDESKPPAIP